MAVSIQKLVVWSGEVENRPGGLRSAVGPLAEAGVDLQVVMAYEKPGNPDRSMVEVAPVTSVKATRAAQAAGLSASGIPCLLVEGDNRPGVTDAISGALGSAGLNGQFLVALVVGRKYRAVFGFSPGTDMGMATKAIRGAAAAKPKPKAKAKAKRKGR
jgi:hypothetical protein